MFIDLLKPNSVHAATAWFLFPKILIFLLLAFILVFFVCSLFLLFLSLCLSHTHSHSLFHSLSLSNTHTLYVSLTFSRNLSLSFLFHLLSVLYLFSPLGFDISLHKHTCNGQVSAFSNCTTLEAHQRARRKRRLDNPTTIQPVKIGPCTITSLTWYMYTRDEAHGSPACPCQHRTFNCWRHFWLHLTDTCNPPAHSWNFVFQTYPDVRHCVLKDQR